MNPAIPIATVAALALAASARRRGSAQLDPDTLARFKAAAGELIRASGVAGLHQVRELWRGLGMGDAPMDLSGTSLWGAELEGADLRGVNLREASLEDADLSHADLTDADLREAILNDANFFLTTMTRANLRGAQLYGADFTKSEWGPPPVYIVKDLKDGESPLKGAMANRHTQGLMYAGGVCVDQAGVEWVEDNY